MSTRAPREYDHGVVRRLVPLALLIALAAVSSASAATDPTVGVSPKRVGTDAVQTVRGSHWPVIEFCSRTVRVSVRGAQNAVPIGRVRVRDDGTFRLRYIPRKRTIGPGDWRLVARMRCESGKDGSPVPVRATVSIRVV
jgi:hypothetical protein